MVREGVVGMYIVLEIYMLHILGNIRYINCRSQRRRVGGQLFVCKKRSPFEMRVTMN